MVDLYGRVILVAEEEYFIADNVARVLEKSGADILGPVSTLGGALTLLDVLDRVDGAVLDIHLHDEAVHPLIDTLKERGIPYVFATGSEEATFPPSTRMCLGGRRRTTWTTLSGSLEPSRAHSSPGSAVQFPH
jgi:CheY-like chemotaxis protein